MIKPDIQGHQVEEFLWGHIRRDIEDLHQILSVSVEDAILAMHLIVNNILTKHNQGRHTGIGTSALNKYVLVTFV